MFQIAEVLPKEVQGILACCNPIPPLVKTEVLTLHNIIREAREQPLGTCQVLPKRASLLSVESTEDFSSKLISKHDLLQVEDSAVSGLPCLLNKEETLLGDLFSNNKFPIKFKKKSSLFGCGNVSKKN